MLFPGDIVIAEVSSQVWFDHFAVLAHPTGGVIVRLLRRCDCPAFYNVEPRIHVLKSFTDSTGEHAEVTCLNRENLPLIAYVHTVERHQPI